MTAAHAKAHVVFTPDTLLDRTYDLRLRDSEANGVPRAIWEQALLGPLRELFARPGKGIRARLVELGYTLGAGDPLHMPEELPLIVEVLHAASLVVDDIEDGSEQRRGGPTLHRVHGLPVALNAANWLYFLPQQLVRSLALPAELRLLIYEEVGECLLCCHEGQALDVGVRADELAQQDVLQVTRAISSRKTGGLSRLALSLGAICAGASAQRIAALQDFGVEVGVGLQMLDDIAGVLNPSRRDKAVEDLLNGRATWVMAWLAEDLDPNAYAAHAADLAALRQAGTAQACDGVIERARFRLGVTGVRRARRTLEAALETLCERIGDGPHRRVLREELRMIEQRFLGGR